MEILVCIKQVPDATKVEVDPAFEAMYGKARELRGLVSGEHGIGFAKKRYLSEQYGPEYMELMKNIKLAFDPKNILNPGKIF